MPWYQKALVTDKTVKVPVKCFAFSLDKRKMWFELCVKNRFTDDVDNVDVDNLTCGG